MTVLLVACGALAREVIALRDKHEWSAKVLAVPALLHNEPHRIPGAVAKRIQETADQFERTIIVYGDCGTAGALDTVLEDLEIARISGPHCYEQYAGAEGFDELMDEEPGTFFLTDYLAQSFDHLVLEGMGIDQNPALRDIYFANYKRVVYLQQREDPKLLAKARAAAKALDMPLEVHPTGYGALEERLAAMINAPNGNKNNDGSGGS